MQIMETFALGLLLAFSGVGTAQTAPVTTGAEDTYLAAIKAWEATENRTVSPKAREVIAFAFAQYGPEFEAVGGDTVWNGSGRTRKETFLVCYLNRLRDRFPSFEAVGPVAERPPSEDREMKFEDGGTYDIERYDVARYTVDSFMRDVRPVLVGHKGELVVIPEELPSVVSVDGYEIGRAGTVSVESAGEHRVVVRNMARRCEAKIVVVDGASVVVRCP